MPDTIAEAAYMPMHGAHPTSETQRDAMHRTLTEAAQRANRLQRPVLASYTLSLATTDPLDLYASAEASAATQAWYWEQPSRALAFAAFGVSVEWQADSDGPAASSAAWRVLLADAVIVTDERSHAEDSPRPLGFGGFAFDPTAAQTALWQHFPAAALTVPQTILAREDLYTTLTLNARVQPGDDIAPLAAQWQSRVSQLVDAPQAAHTPSRDAQTLHELLPASEWQQMVADATTTIQRGELHKVVLARAVELVAERPLDAVVALRHLRAAYPTATLFAVRRGAQTFIGATPERLARVRRGRVETIALAGTAPRGATADDDQRAADELRRSEKNAGEHAVVVSSIRDALTPLCAAVEIERAPHIRTMPNVLHLETAIAASLLPNKSLLDVVAAMHPTPAVAGFPRADALAYLREHERLDRGWYAGALGWLDAAGDGEYVVALRSALVDGAKTTLFAGCGIVADSQPASEYAESKLKLRVMLEALAAAGSEE
jgi:isochorismate synthase